MVLRKYREIDSLRERRNGPGKNKDEKKEVNAMEDTQ